MPRYLRPQGLVRSVVTAREDAVQETRGVMASTELARAGSPRGGESEQISGWRNILTSALVIGFTTAISLLCILVLATTLTQTRMSGLTIDGVSLSIWKLDSLRQQWVAIRQQISKQTETLANAEMRRSKLNSDRSAAEAKYSATQTALLPLLEQFYFRVRPLDPEIADQIRNQSPAEQHGRIQANRERLRQHAELTPLIESISVAYARYQPAVTERATARGAQEGVIREIEELKGALKGSQQSLGAVFSSIKADLDEANRAKIENALYELHPTAGFISRFMNKLVTTHPDALTLLLVILMGILGSALQITHAFFKRNRIETIGSYFLRVCVGAITALVIFIVAKAGVPVIADASKLGGDAPINPYFVSFLAIVSGLLSENAILSVQAQGARFFGGGTADVQRWARHDLTPLAEKQGISVEILAQYLGCTPAATQAIVKGEEAADPARQRTIAIVLRQDPRDLFTDIPPTEVSSGNSPKPDARVRRNARSPRRRQARDGRGRRRSPED
jgi:hypothetical protein